ncbi:MAG: hypothetical protein AAF725_13760 [Acidobacteriota bacterium]
MERLLLFVFVVYCTTVGVILTMLPWSPAWDRMISLLALPALSFLEAPLSRGAMSGFGLVHLVWGMHDLHLFLVRSLPDGEPE